MDKEEAIKILKNFHDKSALFSVRTALETLHPELKESEDERISKKIKKVLNWYRKSFSEKSLRNEEYDEMFTWLENQVEHKKFRDSIQVNDEVTRNSDGVIVNLSQLKRVAKKSEQKLPIEKLPSEMKSIGESLGFTTQEECDEYNQVVSDLIMSDNKVKPKFHEGEWVVFNDKHESVYQIEKIENFQYTLRHILGGSMPLSFSGEDMIRPWAIQDARDGDVLACNEEILLFKSYSVQGRISLYCWYNGQTNNFHSKEVVDTLMTTRNKIYPATKEQRDILFQKMKEAGYEWDDDKKVLIKKIEEKNLTDFENAMMHIGESFFGKNAGLEPNDTNTIKEQAKLLLELTNTHKWSEDDEKLTNRIEGWLDTLCDYLKDNSPEYIEDVKNTIEQLKSLKYRYAWKPSDEQIRALEYIINNAHNTSYSCKIAKELLEQLKKLKGE